MLTLFFFRFFAFGLASALQRAEKRLPASWVAAVLAGLVFLNGYLMIARKLEWWPR